jgi:cold shock CspA family protein
MQGRKKEKGIDVLMALETYELCMLKRYDVVVLVASDGDHVPLVKKLHGLGCKTMLLGWDFEFKDENTGETQYTRTSNDLWNEVTYPLQMHDLVDEGLKDGDETIQEMFVQRESRDDESSLETDAMEGARQKSTIMSLMNGYGFIRFPDNNLFFLKDDLINADFSDLQIGDEVEFTTAINGRGQRVAKEIQHTPSL